MEERLVDLPNIGPVLAMQLEQAGVSTPDDLRVVGARQAWLRIRRVDASACINRLYALEGAIRGIRWSSLPAGCKAELKEFFDQHR